MATIMEPDAIEELVDAVQCSDIELEAQTKDINQTPDAEIEVEAPRQSKAQLTAIMIMLAVSFFFSFS